MSFIKKIKNKLKKLSGRGIACYKSAFVSTAYTKIIYNKNNRFHAKTPC